MIIEHQKVKKYKYTISISGISKVQESNIRIINRSFILL